jgi:hypothetical protein
MPKILKSKTTVYNQANIRVWTDENADIVPFFGNPFKILPKLQASSELTNKVTAGELFLQTLENSPAQLVTALCNEMKSIPTRLPSVVNKRQNYLTPTARSALAEIKNLVDTTEATLKVIQHKAEAKPQIREQYLELCGLLCKLVNPAINQKSICYYEGNNHYHVVDNDKPLAEAIITILNTTHIPFDGDLPDSFASNKKSISFYQQRNKWFEVSNHSVNIELTFNAEYESLMATIKKMQSDTSYNINFINTAVSIATTIKRQKEESLNSNTSYAIEVIKATHQLLINPQNAIQHQKEYLRLANLAEGKPSLGKQLKGLMQIFLGTALILGGVLIAVTSHGIATPLSAFIIKTGWGIVIGALLGGIGIGAGLNGARLFQNGKRTGLSKQLVELTEINRLRMRS